MSRTASPRLKFHNRFRIERIMGENELPEDDGKWNEVFMRKVVRDLEKEQEENESRLEEAEAKRILRLKILGILKDEEMEERRKGEEKKEHRTKTLAERKFERRAQRNHTSLFKPQEDIAGQMELLNRGDSTERIRNYKRSKDNSDDKRNDDNIYNDNDDDEREENKEGKKGTPKSRNERKRMGIHKYDDDNDDGDDYYDDDFDDDEEEDEEERKERRYEESRYGYREQYLRRKRKENGLADDNDDDDDDDKDYSRLPTYVTQLGRTQAVEGKEVHAGLEKLYEEENLQKLYEEAETLVTITDKSKQNTYRRKKR